MEGNVHDAWKGCMIVFLLVLGMEEMISLAIICVR
jgi:hypothetical protein